MGELQRIGNGRRDLSGIKGVYTTMYVAIETSRAPECCRCHARTVFQQTENSPLDYFGFVRIECPACGWHGNWFKLDLYETGIPPMWDLLRDAVESYARGEYSPPEDGEPPQPRSPGEQGCS